MIYENYKFSIIFRHVGDLGNIENAADGTVKFTLTDHLISLIPDSDNYIVGRAIVVR